MSKMSPESNTKERVKKRNRKAMFNVYNKSFYKLPCQALKNLTSSHPGPDLDNNTSGNQIISKLHTIADPLPNISLGSKMEQEFFLLYTTQK